MLKEKVYIAALKPYKGVVWGWGGGCGCGLYLYMH